MKEPLDAREVEEREGKEGGGERETDKSRNPEESPSPAHISDTLGGGGGRGRATMRQEEI